MATISEYFKQTKTNREKTKVVLPLDSSSKKREGSGPSDQEILTQFDVDAKYGPCIGITRMERWQRAKHFGLNPPFAVFEALKKHDGDEEYQQNLWFHYDL